MNLSKLRGRNSAASAKGVKEGFRFRHESLAFRWDRFRILHFADFKIQRPFGAAVGTEENSCCVRTPFKRFSANCASAVNAYMDMEQRMDWLVWIGGHHVSFPRVADNANCISMRDGYQPLGEGPAVVFCQLR